MSQAGRAIWDWREQLAAAQDLPRLARAKLRRRGLATGLVLAVVGTALNKGLGQATAGLVLLGLGLAHALLALSRPQWLGVWQRFWQRFGELVGRALAWLLLGSLWLVVFVPGGLLLRLQRRDPLHRAPLAEGLSAWIPRRQAADAASCARQFLDEDRQARALQRPVGTLPDPALLADLEDSGRGGHRA